MSWRRQNVLSIAAIVLLLALNTLLPASQGSAPQARALVASSQR